MTILAQGQFVLFGPTHWVVIALVVLVATALVSWARRSGPVVGLSIRWTIAIVLVANEIAYEIYGLYHHGWYVFLQSYLPLHLCGVGVFVVAWALLRPNQIVCELAYFWGLAGTLQAIITPELEYGFPHYRFIEFFVNHGLIVTGALFVVLAMKVRPRPGAVWRTFWLTNAWALVAAVGDWLIGGSANYMYMCGAPGNTANPLFGWEVFGWPQPWPWPRYIPLIEVAGLALVAALYLPFWLRRRSGGVPGDFP